MKNILLSSDSKMKMYLVPDDAADNLEKYCMHFFNEWIWNDPDGEIYLFETDDGNKCAIYEAQDFIDYLNNYIFPDQKSTFVSEVDFYEYEISEEYKNIPRFNF